MTTEQIRIRIDRQQMADLKKTASKCGLDYQTTASVLLIGAIRAVTEAGHKMPLPLTFKLVMDKEELTETSRPYTLNDPKNRK